MPQASVATRLHPANVVSTWFGVGCIPGPAGTWGSIAALPFAWAIATEFGESALAIAAALLFVVGVWASGETASRGGEADPGHIVVDEVVGQWLVLAIVPPGWWLYAIGLVLFRIADIWKPWPASWIDHRFHGGVGIMLDDVIAAAYATAVLAAIRWAGLA